MMFIINDKGMRMPAPGFAKVRMIAGQIRVGVFDHNRITCRPEYERKKDAERAQATKGSESWPHTPCRHHLPGQWVCQQPAGV